MMTNRVCLSVPHIHDNTCTSIICATGSVAENKKSVVSLKETSCFRWWCRTLWVTPSLLIQKDEGENMQVFQQQIIWDRMLGMNTKYSQIVKRSETASVSNTVEYERLIKPIRAVWSLTLWCVMITTDV